MAVRRAHLASGGCRVSAKASALMRFFADRKDRLAVRGKPGQGVPAAMARAGPLSLALLLRGRLFGTGETGPGSSRAPKLADPVQKEPNLVVEFYSR
jgi:hypothetical protein